MVKYLCTSLLLVFILIGCQEKYQPKYTDFGTIENGIYVNTFFGFKMDLPKNWYIKNMTGIEEIAKISKTVLSLSNNGYDIFETSKSTNIKKADPFFTIFKFKLDTTVRNNAI